MSKYNHTCTLSFHVVYTEKVVTGKEEIEQPGNSLKMDAEKLSSYIVYSLP